MVRTILLVLIGLFAFALGGLWWVDVDKAGARFVGCLLMLVGLGFLHLAAFDRPPPGPRR